MCRPYWPKSPQNMVSHVNVRGKTHTHTHTLYQVLFNSVVCLCWTMKQTCRPKVCVCVCMCACASVCVLSLHTDMLHCACKPVTHDGSIRLTLICFKQFVGQPAVSVSCCWWRQFSTWRCPHQDRLEVCNLATPTITVLPCKQRRRGHNVI